MRAKKKNVKGCGISTVVKGIRADEKFWDNCEKVAKLRKTTRNELIVKVMNRYCERTLKNEK